MPLLSHQTDRSARANVRIESTIERQKLFAEKVTGRENFQKLNVIRQCVNYVPSRISEMVVIYRRQFAIAAFVQDARDPIMQVLDPPIQYFSILTRRLALE